jgi:23S rRNA (adenine2503-C2)-methyltransferase
MVKKGLCGLTPDEIYHLIQPSGFTTAHAVSISNNLYKKRKGDITTFVNIPERLKDELEAGTWSGFFLPVDSDVSIDKTVKYLFRTDTGKMFETVFIPENNRNTVCVSTQSGCRMGCPFCVTGRYGFRGNLSAGEIINQIISIPEAGKVTHVVFMGMGEPMDNLENVLKSCEIMTSEWGLAISPRNVTVSSVGITPAIEIFLRLSRCNLTVSIHSPFSDERRTVIPVEGKYPVSKIIEIMKNHTIKKKRRLSLAYVMIKDLNDTDSHLRGLIELIKGSVIRVNLLPYHPIPNEMYSASSAKRMQFFKHNLVISGISASIRKSRGKDISAACGLLATGLK